MLINMFKMSISLLLVVVLMVIYHVPLSLTILYFIPAFLVLVLVTFGFSAIMLHYGVYMDDLSNVISVILRFTMYLSGIFYSVRTRVPKPFNIYLLDFNPVAYCMDAVRESVLYKTTPNLLIMLIWFILSFILSAIGVKLIYRYENNYAKVM